MICSLRGAEVSMQQECPTRAFTTRWWLSNMRFRPSVSHLFVHLGGGEAARRQRLAEIELTRLGE